MLKTILFFLLFGTCTPMNCILEEQEIISVLNVLYSKGILELNKKELNIKLPKECGKFRGKQIRIADFDIKVRNKSNIPTVDFFQISNTDAGKIIIKFHVSGQVYRYRGDIIYKIVEDKLYFENIFFLSEID